MNSELRKAINYKITLWRKYQKYRNDKNWGKYSKQRNKVTKLKRESIRLYFAERCGREPKSKDFWPTIRPFLTNKGCTGHESITITDNDKIITDITEISEKFNTFFVNVAKDIGTAPDELPQEDHPSIRTIKANTQLFFRKCRQRHRYCTWWTSSGRSPKYPDNKSKHTTLWNKFWFQTSGRIQGFWILEEDWTEEGHRSGQHFIKNNPYDKTSHHPTNNKFCKQNDKGIQIYWRIEICKSISNF